ncbi:MAG: hypothetical protein J6X05_07415 [Bacteroidales bacterium]|nr:hypothetical protein [Bacteroidales bacterium]
MKKVFIILLTVMLFAASCRETDEYLPLSPQEDAVYYQTVPYSITVGITPMTDKINGVELKTTFYEGDVIEITNPKILARPAILTSNDCIGKDKATFSGELKVKLGKTLTPASTNLTAALKNSDSTQHLYNDGRPFIDVKGVESNTEGLNRYSYWACEDFTYNTDASAIELTQKTIFVKFEMPFGGVNFSMSSDKTFSSDAYISIDTTLYAVPYGMVLKSDILNLEKTLDENGVCIYKIDYPTPHNCLPGVFSVADNKQVYFSKGNLQTNNTNTIWQFAAHQYDVPQSYNDEWLGQFSWSSGEWYQVNYDLKGISNYQYVMGDQWSMLSFNEWNYLFYKRPNAADKYGVANVAGLEGVILLPDDWTMTDGFTLSSNYSEDEWTQMENAGAVFLPMEGDNTFYYETYSTKFNYWTSPASSFNCISLGLESGYIGLTTQERKRGAVRLVYDRGIYTPFNSVTPVKPTSDVDRCIVVDKGECDYVVFYLCTHGFIEGQKYKLSMKVKADYDDEFKSDLKIGYVPTDRAPYDITPSYSYPETGQVTDYLQFSSEWETVELTGEFKANGWVIGFELKHSNKYYFDDIKLTIDDTEVIINGDCSSDDTCSFAVEDDYQEIIPVTFIDKNSIKTIKPGNVIYEIDFTTLDEYPYYDHASNYELDYENGLILFDDNNNRVAEDIPTLEGKYYSIIVEIRGDEAGELEASMHWNSYSYPINTTIQYGTEWETREFFFDEPVEGDCFLDFKNFYSEQPVYIRNIKVAYQGN